MDVGQVMKKWHFVHREGIKERLDFVVDEGKRALMCFSPVRTLDMLRHYAAEIPPFSTVGVSQALLDTFFETVAYQFTGPIVLVTTDYNTDRSAPLPFEKDHFSQLESPVIAHWFSDNWIGASHPKLTQLPIGINDRHVVGE